MKKIKYKKLPALPVLPVLHSYFFRVIPYFPWLIIRNTILYFFVFYASFFSRNAVILYLTRCYAGNQGTVTFL